MLYLIGGAPRCGKTTVAKHLARLQGCSRVPTDYLGTAFSNYIPTADLHSRYPEWQTRTVDERYARYTPDEIITNYRTKAATIWPGLRDFLLYAVYDQHPMVVEGYHLEPAFVHELCQTASQFPIRALFLYRTDPDHLQADLQRSTDPEDWVLRSATQLITFQRVATMVCQYSAFFHTEAHTYGFPICPMEGPYADRIIHALTLLQEPA